MQKSTEARFIPAPNGSDKRIYLTGDLGLMTVIVFVSFCLLHVNSQAICSLTQDGIEFASVIDDSISRMVISRTADCQYGVPPFAKDKATAKNCSRFPKNPDLYQPLPIPDPTKKPPKMERDDPDVIESQDIDPSIKDGGKGASE
jgi:hypothetical protein